MDNPLRRFTPGPHCTSLASVDVIAIDDDPITLMVLRAAATRRGLRIHTGDTLEDLERCHWTTAFVDCHGVGHLNYRAVTTWRRDGRRIIALTADTTLAPLDTYDAVIVKGTDLGAQALTDELERVADHR